MPDLVEIVKNFANLLMIMIFAIRGLEY